MVPTVAVVTTHKKVTVMMAMHLSEHQKDPPEDEVILAQLIWITFGQQGVYQ